MHVPVSEGQQLGAKGDSAQPSRSRKGRRPGIMVNFRISASVWFGLGFANQPVAELGAGMPTSLLPTHHEATRAPLIYVGSAVCLGSRCRLSWLCAHRGNTRSTLPALHRNHHRTARRSSRNRPWSGWTLGCRSCLERNRVHPAITFLRVSCRESPARRSLTHWSLQT